MTDFISTYSLNTNEINKLVDFDCVKSDRWIDLVLENEGQFSRTGEFMAFDIDGVELVIFYNLSVYGKIEYDRGDYWTPPYCDVDITGESIDVNQVILDNYDIELTKELKDSFSKVIKNNL
jgi:hypothetical protein